MSLLPEQQRAVDYVASRGSAPVKSVRRRIAAGFDAVETRIVDLPEPVARRRPSGGGWSVLEVVDHLIESHRPALPQLETVLEGQDVAEAIPAGLQSPDPYVVPWARLVGQLGDLHAAFLSMFDRADADADAAADNAATAPVLMVVKARQTDGTEAPVEWLERFTWKPFALAIGLHTWEHASQIDRILADVA